MIPILTAFADLFGLIGGAVVYSNLGYSLAAYLTQLRSAVSYGDLLGGLFQIAGLRCARGGDRLPAGATDQDRRQRRWRLCHALVVSGIILIILTDAVFAVVFFYLGI